MSYDFDLGDVRPFDFQDYLDHVEDRAHQPDRFDTSTAELIGTEEA